MNTRYAFISLLLLGSSHALADQYAIHLDTTESADLGNYKDLSRYGEIYTVPATEGYKTILIGPYEDKPSAGNNLNKIREAGYFGAYITRSKDIGTEESNAKKL